MDCNFVPEMHDLGKLAIRRIAASDHSFAEVDWKQFTEPRNLTWYGIRYHMSSRELRDLKLTLPSNLPSDLEDPSVRKSLFLLVLADHLAATVGRAEAEGRAKPVPTLYKLWQPNFTSKQCKQGAVIEPICDDASLQDALNLVSKDPPDAENFFQQYYRSLLVTGEDKSPPNNVTSLYSHAELTGKFYRVLEKEIALSKDRLALLLEGEPVTTTFDAEEKWTHRLVLAKVKFHQQPVRPSDLRVFEKLAICKREFQERHPNNLLFSTADALWLFLPGKSQPDLKDVFKVFTEAGFYVECEVQEEPKKRLSVRESNQQIEILQKLRNDLEKRKGEVSIKIEEKSELSKWLDNEITKLDKKLEEVTSSEAGTSLRKKRGVLGEQKRQALKWKSDLEKEKKEIEKDLEEAEEQIKNLEKKPVFWKSEAFYPDDIKPKIKPHLCEICQMRHGEEVEFAGVTEHLCPRCLEIREGGFSQRKLGEWLEQEERLLWLKVNLDSHQLNRSVYSLFDEYVDGLINEKGEPLSFAERQKLKLEVRTVGLIADFVKDYNEMLEEMNGKLLNITKNIDRLATKDVWVMSIQNGAQVCKILRLYLDLLGDDPEKGYFPRILNNPPIRLGASLAPAKYPFFQHWRYISNPQSPISVNVVGKTKLETTVEALQELLKVDLIPREARGGRSYLHNLARIEEETGSTALAYVKFRSDLQRRREVPPILRPFAEPLQKGILAMRDILAYYKITTWRLKQ